MQVTHRRISILILGLLLVSVVIPPSAAGASSEALPLSESSQMNSPAPYLNADGTLNVGEGINGSFDITGFDVVLDNNLGPVLSPKSQPNFVTADTWEALADNGLNNWVYALVAIGSDLYVGGLFTQTSGGATTGLNAIAKYDTTTGSWSKLTDDGLDGSVSALAVIGSDLFVGGSFSQTFGGATTGLNNIAKYDTTAGSWSNLADDGLNGSVYALAAIGSDLIVGGSFSQTFGGATTGLNNIAKYNTAAGSWSALTDNGLNWEVYALAARGNDLYVGGGFTGTKGKATTGLNRIAKYNTTTGVWTALTDNGLNHWVYALTIIGSDLFVGGVFHKTSGAATIGLNNIAKYNTATGSWSALADNGLNNIVYALVAIGSDLYVGGWFTQTFGGATSGLNWIAKYDNTAGSWSALTDNGLNAGFNHRVESLTAIGNDLYVGGLFTQTNGGATTGLNRIAAYGTTSLPAPAIPSSSTTSTSNTITSSYGRRYAIDNGGGSYRYGKMKIILPAGLIPSGYSNCRLVVEHEADSNIPYGFSNGEAVYKVYIQCAEGRLHGSNREFTVCQKPRKGGSGNLRIFLRHSAQDSFEALPLVSGYSGSICGTSNRFSHITLGELSLPGTGFEVGKVASLPLQPSELAYANVGALTLSIPKLGVELPIVGVPLTAGGWDTTWLNDQAGFLQSTAFPTLSGNTVLTAHVWDANNNPGPFARIKELQHGDQFSIHAWGREYTYEVRTNRLVTSSNLSVLGHKDLDWVTLLTCESFDEASEQYLYRRAVQAVLVSVD